MNGLLIMLGQVTPPEILVDQLEKQVKDYREAILIGKNEKELKELFQQFAVPCILILSKINGEGKNPMEIIKDLDRMEKAQDLLNPEQG